MQKPWKENLGIVLLAINVALMCLTIKLANQILDSFKQEKPVVEEIPQAFYKCGRSNKHDVYCPVLSRSKNGAKTLYSSR